MAMAVSTYMMFCVNCGAGRHASHRFCGLCGVSLSREATGQDATQTESQFDRVSGELESRLGEELYRSVLAHRPMPARQSQAQLQDAVVKPWHRAWFRAAQFGVFMFAVAHAQDDDPFAVFGASLILAAGTWLFTLAIASAVINGRPAQPASSFYVKRFHDEGKQVTALLIACLATGLLIAGSSFARAYALDDPTQIAGVLEGAVWLALACMPHFTLRHTGKVAVLALAGCVLARGFAQTSGFSPAAVVYAALIVTLYRVWSERRFARKYLGGAALNTGGASSRGSADRTKAQQSPFVAV